MTVEPRSSGSWLKLGDAAHVLGVSEITLRRKVKCGRIPHDFRNGKYYVFLYRDEATGHYYDPTGAPEPALSAPQVSRTTAHGPRTTAQDPRTTAQNPRTPTHQLPSINLRTAVQQNPMQIQKPSAPTDEELQTLQALLEQKEQELQGLRRTLEDQQTLIAFLEESLDTLGTENASLKDRDRLRHESSYSRAPASRSPRA